MLLPHFVYYMNVDLNVTLKRTFINLYAYCSNIIGSKCNIWFTKNLGLLLYILPYFLSILDLRKMSSRHFSSWDC